eukprot:TRINITY_DN17346_c0_g1_i1.p1 TRINITY_DN17346_c0_g1~~TRINITY_DN17346_c0_g1_i1.p1  ORF type:complete len:214 (+),score=21.31 TRINITY_DN17346_c0_g1_i1:186-827(+)
MRSPFEKHKVTFLGDTCVGKTSIITRFMYDSFEGNYQATIGIDFLCKNVTVGENTVRLQIWDTAGQERFKSLIPSYIRDSRVVVIVYDVSNFESFDNVKGWVDSVQAEQANASIILVGNKTDLSENAVPYSVGKSYADQISAPFFETSAKSGSGVAALFAEAAKMRFSDKSNEPFTSVEQPSDTESSNIRKLDPFTIAPTQESAPKSTCGGCY